MSRKAWCILVLPFVARTVAAQIPKPTDAPRPLTPEASAAAFALPPGFTMQVVASEPLIASPSGVAWDERGRMFVSELHGYNLEGQLDIEALNQTGKLDTQVRRVQADERFKQAARAGTYGVVKLLRDEDGDGRMDHAEVWARDLPPAYGLVAARGGVIVAAAPDIVYLADRDGDGKVDVRETLFTGFKTGPLERGINAPQWGADGWIHFGRGHRGSVVSGPHLRGTVVLPDADFRIKPDGTAIEPLTGGTHTFGFAETEAGDRFVVNTTIPAIFVAPLPWRYLLRNPDVVTPSLEAPTGDGHAYGLAPPHPWRTKRAEDPAYFKYYRDRYGAAESEAKGWFTAACSPFVYRDLALPGLQGQFFVAEPAGNLIHRALIAPAGPALTVRRAPDEAGREFAASRDPWSHPMFLTHGPDGAIWVVDYYREIIEDYSAIPRHLQQQYGLYAGHDRGRVYRLWHRDAPAAPAPDLRALDADALARELASPLLWRRQTAARLLRERQARAAVPAIRRLLATEPVASETAIAALEALDALGALGPGDVLPLVRHPALAARVHAWQLADRWFGRREGRALLAAALAAAGGEKEPRVLVQLALSLGEATRDARALAALARLGTAHADLRWMDTAVLSSLHARGGDMLALVLRDAATAPPPWTATLAQAIGARGDERERARAVLLAARAAAPSRALLLAALARGHEAGVHAAVADAAARRALTALAEHDAGEAGRAAQALLQASRASGAALAASASAPPAMEVSDATFRKYVAALAGARDLPRGHVVFRQACAPCHRVGDEGSVVGPDLVGELGVAEETLVRHVLLPSEHIRPGYETVEVRTRAGGTFFGLMKEEGATSVTLLGAGGAEQVVLRKDLRDVRRLPASLMPSYAEALSPADLANLLAWLRSNLHAAAPGR